MQKADHPNTNHSRKAFMVDIINCIKSLKTRGKKVILCMDANTHRDHKDITTLKEETAGLADLMQTANPGNPPPPATYDRGDPKKGNIDIALGCEEKSITDTVNEGIGELSLT